MAIFTDRTLYPVTQNNLLIATSSSGVGTPEMNIATATTANGTITTLVGNTAVVGVGTFFTTELTVGDYLYTNADVYIGRVLTITDNTNLVLATGGAYTAITGQGFKKKSSDKVNISGDFLLRIAVVPNSPTTVQIPRIDQLRSPNSTISTVFTDTSLIQMTRDSDFNNPSTNIAPVNVPVTIERLTQFQQTTPPTGNYFATTSDFPQFVWYRLNAFGNTTELLGVKTRYNLRVEENLPDVTITTNMSFSTINNGQY